ncbi:WD40 repeat-like protein [Hypoxylon crocopeplum]|nr:WD40 repeat-like protein [Hypoxylon crocopeplum]
MSREQAALGHLRREYVLNPITALAFYTSSTDGQQYLLAGEDTDIKVYHFQTSRLCGQLPVFRAQSIHGIAVPPENEPTHQSCPILVWGAYSVRVLSGDAIEGAISGQNSSPNLTRSATAEARAPDWIFDGRISPFGDGRVVLLTAHNEVIQAHVDLDRGSLIFGSIQSPSRPILFSGNFFWVSKDCVLVAAGTVFGEILVWKCHLGASVEQDPTCEVLFVFTGHEGSIFGVHISPEIRTPTGETLRLLASCSDDRTIRVWDITEKRDGARAQRSDGYENHISDARETGFGNNIEDTTHDDSSARCLATAMGHASRIWQVGFPQDQSPSQTSDLVELYSFGEDATVQKWNFFLDLRFTSPNSTGIPLVKRTARLTHQSTLLNHGGKHIWSHATTFKDDLLIATGGADGKITLITADAKKYPREVNGDYVESIDSASNKRTAVAWPLADVMLSSQARDVSVDTQEKLSNSSSSPTSPSLESKPKNAKEAFNRYTFISDRRLLAATNSGQVFVGTFGDELKWSELTLPDEIGQIIFSHALLGTSAMDSMALIGTANGDIYSYTESGGQPLQLLTKVDGKIGDIYCLSHGIDMSVKENGHVVAPGGETTLSSNSPSQFLVTILRSTKAVIIQVDPSSTTTEHIEVALDLGFMVTSATFSQGHLVLGSRKGTIAVFKQGEDGNYSTTLTFEIHQGEAITSILPLRSRDGQSKNYILTTCRDGKYRIHEITGASAILLHETLSPFVSSIEGAWFSEENRDGTKNLMLCGFRSNNLVVWDETQGRWVVAVDCGGASRSYAWTPLRDRPDGFRFVFTKAGQMHVFSQTSAPHRTLKSGGHGREIKAVSASGRYIATAAEDTVIRIWDYGGKDVNGEGRGLCCVAALERHATGIQAMKWYKNKYLFSSGGNEEFFVWKINRIQSDDFPGLAVVCEAVFPDHSEVGDARITDFDVTCTASDDEFRVSMALSNSTLQTYTYAHEAGFRLLRRSTYTGACLTQIRHLGESHTLTAATDGYIAIYPNTDSTSPSGQCIDSKENSGTKPVVAKLHQNTVKTLDVRQVATTTADNGISSSTEYIIVTGGDDNALGVMHVSLSLPLLSSSPTQAREPVIEIKTKAIIRPAHAAAITGVAITSFDDDDNKGNPVVVVTSSNDQRVKVWRLVDWRRKQQDSKLRAQLLEERYSSVADAGGLEVFDDGGAEGGKGKKRAIVVGVGVEVWELGI